jgi:hypothetical protein
MNRRSARGALGSSAIGFIGRARPLFMSRADRDRARRSRSTTETAGKRPSRNTPHGSKRPWTGSNVATGLSASIRTRNTR